MKKILFILGITVIAFAGCVEEPCDDVFCLNNGVPVEQGLDCFCECAEGFEGPNCADEVQDPCANVTCQNNGTCNEDGTCDCPPGFEGASCELLICDRLVCENGGNCVDGTCNCAEGYSGVNCEIDDACVQVECLNGGTCNLGYCDCPEGFIGANCEIEIATSFVAEWDALETCVTFQDGAQFEYVATIRENMAGLEILNFAAFDPYSAFTAVSVTGNTITLNLSEIMTEYGVYQIEGTGVLSDDGNTIAWTYTTSLDGVADSCSGTWTRRP